MIVDVALIHQHFPAQDVVARESVPGKLQPPQRELLALVDGNQKVSDTFVCILGIILESWRDFGGVLNEPLGAVILLEILVERLADSFAVGDLALFQADNCLDHGFRENRVAFDFHFAQTIELAVDDWNGNTQRVVCGRKKRDGQNRKAGAAPAQALDARLAVARLQVAL